MKLPSLLTILGVAVLPTLASAQYADYGPNSNTLTRFPNLFYQVPEDMGRRIDLLNEYLAAVNQAVIQNNRMNGFGVQANVDVLSPERQR